jgi:hypothetical protein
MKNKPRKPNKPKKSESEIQNDFYQWTLKKSKEENVGQEVIFFRHIRKQISEIDKRCSCGKKIPYNQSTCYNCLERAWKQEEGSQKRNKEWVNYYNGTGEKPE